MNQLDSARIAAALLLAGHEQAEDETTADTIFVNSCTVTARADRQSRQESLHAARLRKKLAIFGCGPKVDEKVWRRLFPHAQIFKTDQELFAHFGLSADTSEFPLRDHIRLPVAIQTGCDNKCTFCLTRIARGKTVDFPVKNILRQIKRAENIGIAEIVLTGIQLASWGCENSEKHPESSRLPELLNTILEQTAIPRIRLSSLGPQFLNADFFNIFKNKRICDHLHLSVQSGSPAVLRRMNRGHGIEEVYRIAEQAKKARPDVALTTDLIVGFPGESAADFAQTLQMTAAIGFAKLHVFPFSPRSGTGAANFPDQLPQQEKKLRARILREQGDQLRTNFIASQLGKISQILIIDSSSGLSTNYLRLRNPGKNPGQIAAMRVAKNILLEDG